MFCGGRPQQRGHDQQFAPCEPTPYVPPPDPSTAPFGPDLGPAPCHLPPGQYPYGTGFVEKQARDRHGFTPYYQGECRRSPSGRRYPPPGSGENHGLGSGPPREHTSKPPDPSLLHGGFSIDHSLVLSIGNGQTCSSSRAECFQFPDPRRAHSLGQDRLKNERASEEFLSCLAAKEKYPVPERAADKGDPHYRPPHPGKEPGCGADYQGHKRRSLSRGRSYRRSQGRSKSRARSRSRSRGRSRGRSKSKPWSRSRSRGKSRGRSKSKTWSRSRSRGRSRGRSKSKPWSRSRSRGKSRGRSKSRPRSQSGSCRRSRERSRSRREGRGQRPGQSGSTNTMGLPSKSNMMEVLQRLMLASRRKELEEMLSMSSTSTMKKPLVSENKPPGSSQTRDPFHEASAEHQSSVLSRETARLLGPMAKGMESGLFASFLEELRAGSSEKVQLMRQNLEEGQYADSAGRVKQEPQAGGASEVLLPHERVSQDSSGFSRILGLMGERRSIFMDIEDEEEFLYGDGGESRAVAKSGGSTGIGGHLTLGRPHLQAQPDIRGCQPSQPTAVTSERDSKAGASCQLSLPNSRPPGAGPQEEKETPNMVDFEKIKKALQTIGLDKNLEEICNMASRTRECLVAERLEDRAALPRGRSCSASQKRSDSPSPQRDSRASKMDTLVNLDPQIAHMGISHPQRNFDENSNKKRKVTEEGERLKTDRQILMKRKEYLMKELEILLKQQGSEFLVPVIGFYCQVCEEFLGDIASADNHAMCHSKGKHKKHADGLYKLSRNIDGEERAMELKRAAFKEWPQGHSPKDTREQVLVKEEEPDIARPEREAIEPRPAMPSSTREGKEEKAKNSVEKVSKYSKSAKKKKKKKEKKEKKKEKKRKKERKTGDSA
ncbi:zinc finger protein 318 [Megalops cyprinoides]|uniref:zinc finger protein 318 n=1 Tax=Megalops cyprinoides TaxID=118141 RepID=UPI00186488BC|nr:zinc finger protein 318 [Megalops cyprinoides]